MLIIFQLICCVLCGKRNNRFIVVCCSLSKNPGQIVFHPEDQRFATQLSLNRQQAVCSFADADNKGLRWSENPSNPLQCAYCGRNFHRKSQMSRHISDVHQKITYDCVHCSKFYHSQGALYKHVKKWHS